MSFYGSATAFPVVSVVRWTRVQDGGGKPVQDNLQVGECGESQRSLGKLGIRSKEQLQFSILCDCKESVVRLKKKKRQFFFGLACVNSAVCSCGSGEEGPVINCPVFIYSCLNKWCTGLWIESGAVVLLWCWSRVGWRFRIEARIPPGLAHPPVGLVSGQIAVSPPAWSRTE